jgi:hypothetical protein
MRTISILFCFSLSAAPALAQHMEIEIIQLNNRFPEDIISIVQPLIVDGGTVTGAQDKLIVKSTRQNIDEIKSLLGSLDRPLRRLAITVRQDIDGYSETSGHGISGNYSTGDIELRNRTPGNRRGAEISTTDRDGNTVRYNNRNTLSYTQDNNDYRLQTIEGQAAFIDMGQSVPIPSQTAYHTGNGVVIQNTVDYYDATSGFYVEPRLSGDRVTLYVSPYMTRVSRQHGGVFDVQNAQTTVQGKLGQWIEIGGVNQQQTREVNGILYSTNRDGKENRSMFIKVEEIF